MNPSASFQRGQVLLADLPFADITASKVRPVVLVQNDVANALSGNLIVVSVTSRIARPLLPTQLLLTAGTPEAQQAGLSRDSVIDCGVIYTIAKARIRRTLGHLPPTLMAQVDARLKLSLDLK